MSTTTLLQYTVVVYTHTNSRVHTHFFCTHTQQQSHLELNCWTWIAQSQAMDSFLREGVDLAGFASQAIAGDAHFFEDALSPAKIKSHLDSNQVSLCDICFAVCLIACCYYRKQRN